MKSVNIETIGQKTYMKISFYMFFLGGRGGVGDHILLHESGEHDHVLSRGDHILLHESREPVLDVPQCAFY